MKKLTVYALIFSLLVLFFVPVTTSAASSNTNDGIVNPITDISTFQENDILTIPWLSQQYGVTELQIIDELNKGYSLKEVYRALQIGNSSEQSMEDRLDSLNPAIRKAAKLAKQPNAALPTVTAATYSSVTNSTYDTVTNSIYSPIQRQLMSSSINDPLSYDELAVKRLNTQVDIAPYSIATGHENVSTISGGLQLENVDLTLPGRNGMSFGLKRIYDSSTASSFDKKAVGTRFKRVIYAPEMEISIKMWQKTAYGMNGMGPDIWTKVGTNQSFNSTYNYFIWWDHGISYRYDNPFSEYITEYGDDVARKRLEEKYAAFYYQGKSILIDRFSIDGVVFEAELFPTGRVFQVGSWVADLGPGYYNKAVASSMAARFPIGTGWRWDLPYIEEKDNKKFIHLFGGSAYELESDLRLKGYPWKGLTLQNDSSIRVNNVASAYALTTADGGKQYFASNGRLIQINDAYVDNKLQFEYGATNGYGEQLFKIKDVLGNEININYDNTRNEVVLTSGDRSVKYQKTKDEFGRMDLLSAVTDSGGRTTQYIYKTESAPFDLVNSPFPIGENQVALLKQVFHPTKARSEYTYESFNRKLGYKAWETAYRVKAREDVVDYSNGNPSATSNRVDFEYPIDGGANQQLTFDFSTIVKDGLKKTTYSYTKQYIDDNTPEVYYNNEITQEAGAGADKRTTKQLFDENRKQIAVPKEITTTVTSGTSTSQPVKIKQTYDDYGNLLTETNPLNESIVTTYTYIDKTNWLKSIQQPVDPSRSKFIEIERNDKGSVTKQTVKENNAGGKLYAQVNYDQYDTFGNAKTVTIKDDNRNIVMTREFDPQYQSAFLTKQSITVLDAESKSSTVSQTMTYNAATGQMTSYTDGRQGIMRYAYDKLGRLTQATFPDLEFITHEYNDTNNQITSTDQTKVKTVTKWNPFGLKDYTQVVGAGTGKQSFQYDAYSRLWKSQDARGNTTEYQYDPWSRVKQVIYPDTSESVDYDDINRTKTAKDGEQNRVRESYDLVGRSTEVVRLNVVNNVVQIIPVSSVLKYDYVGHALEATDADPAHLTKYAYDVLGRLTSVEDANKNTTGYAYSLANQLTEVQYPDGNKVQKQYDEMGRLIKKIDPAGQMDKYYYDGNSNLVKQIDRKGQTLEYQYNSRDDLTKSISLNETIGYDYDAAGRRLWMQDGTGKTVYTYVPATSLLDTMTYADGRTMKITYGSEGLGNRVAMIDPFGLNTAYSYDTRNRLSGVGEALNNWEASYTYKKNGLADITTLKNGISTSYTFDGAKLTDLVQKKNSGANVNTFAYGYDNNSNQTSKTENGVANSYTYDKLNRIDTSTQFQEKYTYDNRGNRQTLQSSQTPNLAGASYEYDDRNRLTKVTTDDGKVVAYKYNGDGLLYQRTENGQTTRYYYDGANLIAEGIVAANGTATMKARYIRGNGLATRVDANGNKAYYQVNGHGDVVGLTDASGNTLNTYTYDMWGNPLTTQETVSQPFRYSGEMTDSTTGLQYLRARWYDPSMGRFINER
ncbi:hypothetical protein LOZ80_39065 [Paenibacillus sp. HWE-109]|uniref:RHS repeat-associated core domain-containing protein n=1 Tax=Paenibacillus sp. HWE-109 TaxID=1306526 RepID=UPI001EE10B91|nr:RHS repeat-associated core domain-containing protein [Paenibacillus sp. HWE-109]UKS27368.1 hypothetical protein LOZ80_39065 [Paenibacillus sp. HWE-109]